MIPVHPVGNKNINTTKECKTKPCVYFMDICIDSGDRCVDYIFICKSCKIRTATWILVVHLNSRWILLFSYIFTHIWDIAGTYDIHINFMLVFWWEIFSLYMFIQNGVSRLTMSEICRTSWWISCFPCFYIAIQHGNHSRWLQIFDWHAHNGVLSKSSEE